MLLFSLAFFLIHNPYEVKWASRWSQKIHFPLPPSPCVFAVCVREAVHSVQEGLAYSCFSFASPHCFKVCHLESHCIPLPPYRLIKDTLFADWSPAFQTCSACYSFIVYGSKHWRVLHFCELVKKGHLSVWRAMNYEYDKVTQGEEECSCTTSLKNTYILSSSSLTQA